MPPACFDRTAGKILTSPAVKNKLNLTLGALFLGSVVLTGCTVGPDYETPAGPVPSAYKNGSSKAEGSACREDWWKIFKDSQLNKLVDAAHGQNRSLRASYQRVQQAHSTIRVTRADLFPQIGTGAEFNRSRTSKELDFGGATGFNTGRTTSTYSLPVNAAWEIDLFGRVRRSTEASTADAQAQEEDFAAMRLSVEADVASTYFRIRALDREIGLVAESVGLRQDSVKLVKERFDQGVVGELDLAQAKTQLSQSKAEIAALRRQRSQYENALALLIGAPASGFSLGSNPLSGTPPRVPSGLPSELLRARPDIRMAERKMAGDGARIGVATAEFYPSVTLVGNVGVSASEVGNLFQSSAGAWVINPSVTLPIFQGFRNKANLERAEAAS